MTAASRCQFPRGISVPDRVQVTGFDSLLSMVQMPGGIPVATVAIDGAQNAAILAAQILALSDDTLAVKLDDFKKDMEAGVEAKDKKLQETLNA